MDGRAAISLSFLITASSSAAFAEPRTVPTGPRNAGFSMTSSAVVSGLTSWIVAVAPGVPTDPFRLGTSIPTKSGFTSDHSSGRQPSERERSAITQR